MEIIMEKITSFYVFVAIAGGEERIMMVPDKNGNTVPLAYTSKDEVDKAKIREIVEELVKKYKMYFELREYKLTGTLEIFEPEVSSLSH